MKELFNEYKGSIAVVGVVVLLAIIVNGIPKQSEAEKKAQANAQEIIKLVNTQNNFNNKILENKKIIDNANKAISGAMATIDETTKLMNVTNDKLKKFNLKYGD